MQPSILHNTVQAYAWGSTTLMSEYLGIQNPDGKPQAELWMGSHPLAPSRVVVQGREVGLDHLIARDPAGILGIQAAKIFSGQLPFLFKVLAAGLPLSIQAHPDKLRAEKGFERENQAGIPLHSPLRNYKDPNHKPEIICALSDFEALCSFRKSEEIGSFFSGDGSEEAFALKESLSGRGTPRDRIKGFFGRLMTMDEASVKRLIDWALETGADSPERRMAARLASCYPGDRGALAPFFLNLIALKPGEAIALKAGELHAYLSGLGMECMANSDNVLRGGLTSKHIDLHELSACLSYEGREVGTVPVLSSGAEEIYATDFEEFILSRITLGGGTLELSPDSAQILFCTEGKFCVRTEGAEVRFFRGESVFVAASKDTISLSGTGTLYRASIPAAHP